MIGVSRCISLQVLISPYCTLNMVFQKNCMARFVFSFTQYIIIITQTHCSDHWSSQFTFYGVLTRRLLENKKDLNHWTAPGITSRSNSTSSHLSQLQQKIIPGCNTKIQHNTFSRHQLHRPYQIQWSDKRVSKARHRHPEDSEIQFNMQLNDAEGVHQTEWKPSGNIEHRCWHEHINQWYRAQKIHSEHNPTHKKTFWHCDDVECSGEKTDAHAA